MWYPAFKDGESRPPSKRWPRDIVWSFVVVGLFAAHFAEIFGQLGPYWTFCCFFFGVARYSLPVIAIILAVTTMGRHALEGGASKALRRVRLGLAILLSFLAIDTLTGGDYRWFELAMRYDMARFGGMQSLQSWAQNNLETVGPDESWGYSLHPMDMPKQVQNFAAQFQEAGYIHVSDGQTEVPTIDLSNGGAELHWGIVLTKRDMASLGSTKSPFIGRRNVWIKQLQPGVFLYAVAG